jgi:phage repressor protein C with HTH and peptisase S24 domain
MKDFNLLSNRLEWCVTEKQQREDRRIYNAELARIAGVSRTAVTNWMQNTNGMDATYARPLSEFFGVNPLWLETGQGSPETIKKAKKSHGSDEIDLDDGETTIAIKRAEFKLSAGISGYSIEYIDGEKSPISFRKDWLDRKGYIASKLVAVNVRGSSMEPSLYDDDLVVINTADTKHIDTEVYAFNYDGELVIKRLMRENGNWYMSSDNTDKRKYPNRICSEDSFVIGRIIYKQSERI